jgi:alpha-amylase
MSKTSKSIKSHVTLNKISKGSKKSNQDNSENSQKDSYNQTDVKEPNISKQVKNLSIKGQKQNKKICFYFQVHQPFRINKVDTEILHTSILQDFFEGPNPANKGADASNRTIFNKVAKSCYIPATQKWIQLFEKFDNLKMTLSFSGTFLEQCLRYEEYGGEVIETFQKFYSTSRVEILSETYYHSLAFLYDTEEYINQINKHRDIVGLLFNTSPTSFRNTEIIYNDKIGEIIRNLGYKSMLISQVKDNLDDHHINLAIANKTKLSLEDIEDLEKYTPPQKHENLGLLLGNKEYLDKLFFMNDLDSLIDQISSSESEVINIFTDYEIFGEHNDETFYSKLEDFIEKLIKEGFEFVTPKEIDFDDSLPIYKCQEYSTWANSTQDLKSWAGNEYQDSAHQIMTGLIKKIKNYRDKISTNYDEIIDSWRKLSTSDHFYYMPELDGADGLMHAMFNPYSGAKEAYEYFMHAAKYLESVINEFILFDSNTVAIENTKEKVAKN